MLMCQSILFFIYWFMMLKNLVGIRVSPALMLLGNNYYSCCLFFICFSFNSGDLSNTSSHICDSWYLPIFLIRDGSLTLISMASLMVLVMLSSSLPTMLKLLRNTSWPVVLKWSYICDGDFMCSLNLSANVLPVSHMYSSTQSTLPHLYLWITPLFLSMLSLSFGGTRTFLMVLAPTTFT